MAVPASIKLLAHHDRWMQTNAVRALGKIGPAAVAAIPALTAMQDNENVGALAKQALKDIGGT